MLDSNFNETSHIITRFTHHILAKIGVSEQWINYANVLMLIALVAIIVYILQLSVNKALTFVFKKITKATPLLFFKYAINNRIPHFLALVVPFSFVKNSIPIIFDDFQQLISPCTKLMDIYLVFMVIWAIMAVIHTGGDIIQDKPAFKSKPLRSYLQVIQIILFIFGAVVIYSILTGKSPTAFFAAMGAASAVLMLMFKDTIMGFVASIQISTNNMVQIGDWITMSKYGADGNVEEITLTTVKVINFDNTVTTIPTYALISDSFQNWRGMQESGGRRFTRSIHVKQTGIRFVSEEELKSFAQINYLTEFISQKQAEYVSINEKLGFSGTSIGAYRLTNNDLYIQYISCYLSHHPSINQNMTLLVRQLAATAQGLPIQVYAFTNTTSWVEYEAIINEVLNHLISITSVFGLSIFEELSNLDLQGVSPSQNTKLVDK